MLSDQGIEAINKALVAAAIPNGVNVRLFRSLLATIEEKKDGAAIAQAASVIAQGITADATSQVIMTAYADPAEGLEVGAGGHKQPEYRLLELTITHMMLNCICSRLSMMDQEQIPDLLQMIRNDISTSLEEMLDRYA